MRTQGYFATRRLANATPSCKPCPTGARCAWDATLGDMETKPNYWRLTAESDEVLECRDDWDPLRNISTPCPGGAPHACEERHTGPECKVCAESLHHVGDDGMCQRCPNGAIPIIVAVGSLAGGLLLTFLIGRLAFKPPRSMQAAITKVQVFFTTVRDLGPSKFKAALTFYQIICSLPKTFDLYPVSVEFEGVYKVFQFFELDWSEAVYPRGCISGGYSARLFVIALVPVLSIIAVPVLTFVLIVFFVILGNVGACFGLVDKREANLEIQIAIAMQMLQRMSGSAAEDGAASSASSASIGSAVPCRTETRRARTAISLRFRDPSPSLRGSSSPTKSDSSASLRDVTASVRKQLQRSTSQA
eukprot:7247137-Prymnesium_polylepis.1